MEAEIKGNPIEIPVWYGGSEKWITGIHRRTTCDDVVKALISSSVPNIENNNKDHSDYVLVEKWRKVERALDPKSRIMKLWNKWGDEKSNVKLSLKRIHQPQLKVSAESNKENAKHRRHHHHKSSKYNNVASKSWHPRKLEDARDMSDTVDRLIKLIMSQTETISYQLAQLLDKDKRIEQYETQIHELRMTQIGANYVQDAYLQERNENTESTGTTIEKVSEGGDDIDSTIAIYNNVLELLLKLEKEENTIVSLEAELKQIKESGPETELSGEIEILKSELERLAAVYRTRENVLSQNDRFICDSDRTLCEKQDVLARLQSDLQDADHETERLQKQVLALCQCSDPAELCVIHTNETQVTSTYTNAYDLKLGCEINAFVEGQTRTEPSYPSPINSSPINCKGDTDSVDSDTGLSSLHSSSDEAAYVLDTLV